jgi:hypothetical protein
VLCLCEFSSSMFGLSHLVLIASTWKTQTHKKGRFGLFFVSFSFFE